MPVSPAPSRAAHWLRVTATFGERDRTPGGGLVADALGELYAARHVHSSVVLRGRQGFGRTHDVQDAALEVLSLDLPVVSTALDRPEVIERLLPAIGDVVPTGLITIERVQMVSAERPAEDAIGALALSAGLGDAVKVTVRTGRRDRTSDGRAAHRAVVELLRSAGAFGAAVFLGVDGTRAGERARARFFHHNPNVPVVAQGIGTPTAALSAIAALQHALPSASITVERARVCKRDGALNSPPPPLPDSDHHGVEQWQKLSVHGALADRTPSGGSVHSQILRSIRGAGGLGATTVEGIWGFQGDQTPRGDDVRRLVRHVPVLTTIVDRPSRIEALFGIVDELTSQRGLVTCEAVPTRQVSAHAARARLAQVTA